MTDPLEQLRRTRLAEINAANGTKSGDAKTGSGIITMPPRRGNGSQADPDAGKTVWLVDNGRLAGRFVIDELGVSDKTWVEVRGEAAKVLAEGQELAISFSKQEPGAASAGTKK